MKPLFHEKTLLKVLKKSSPLLDPDAKAAVIGKWIAALKSRSLNLVKEVSLHGDFLHDLFCIVLGYRSVIQGEGREWTLYAEAHIADGGGVADGALGLFGAADTARGAARLKGRIVAPIELKGVANDLDRPASGRNESAVEQGWRYANYTAVCRWIIVSNYREIRLYHTSKTPAFYERFLLEELADRDVLKRFHFLLGASNLLPKTPDPGAKSRMDLLIRESDDAEEEITRALYGEYKETRLKLIRSLQENASPLLDKEGAVETAQKILDRILFIAFCEDRGLLPPATIKNAHDHRDPYNTSSIWSRYKAVFRWVDEGNDDPPIPGYNGGLYRRDPVIDDHIELPDELCAELKALTRYDYDTDQGIRGDHKALPLVEDRRAGQKTHVPG